MVLRKREAAKITAEEIVAEIQAKAARDKTRKMSLSDIQIDWFCPLSSYFIGKVFSDRADAIRAAGLYPMRPNRVDLILSLWDFYLESGLIPRPRDAIYGALIYSEKSYERYLADGGCWRDVLIAARMIEPDDGEGQLSYRNMPSESVKMPPEIAELLVNRTNPNYYRLVGAGV